MQKIKKLIYTLLFAMAFIGCGNDVINTVKSMKFEEPIRAESPYFTIPVFNYGVELKSVIDLAAYFATLESIGLTPNTAKHSITMDEWEKEFNKVKKLIEEEKGYIWKEVSKRGETHTITVASKKNSFRLIIDAEVVNNMVYINTDRMRIRVFGSETSVRKALINL